MKPVFGDTAYFLALLNRADQHHKRAVALSQAPPGPLLTTDWILAEVGNVLRAPPLRPRFVRLMELLQRQPDVELVEASRELFRRGCAMFRARPEKDWSLTDCISFLVMSDHGVTDALTTDLHFEQAGFRVLMKVAA